MEAAWTAFGNSMNSHSVALPSQVIEPREPLATQRLQRRDDNRLLPDRCRRIDLNTQATYDPLHPEHRQYNQGFGT